MAGAADRADEKGAAVIRAEVKFASAAMLCGIRHGQERSEVVPEFRTSG